MNIQLILQFFSQPLHPAGESLHSKGGFGMDPNQIRLDIPEQQPNGSSDHKAHFGSKLFRPNREFSNPRKGGFGIDPNQIRLDIPEQQPNGSSDLKAHFGSKLFRPHREFSNPAPEKKLTHFALRLAVLEKAASGLGTLGFVWATVVLLGGFASTLSTKDFWFVTVILLTEGTRIFSRSNELKWQHQATKTGAGRHSFRKLVSGPCYLFRAVKLIFRPLMVAQSESSQSHRLSDDIQLAQRQSSDVQLLQYAGRVFLSKNINRILYWLQLLSAIACAALSLMCLIQQDYGEITTDTKNGKPALNIFYALALAEALMFLLEKAYWELKVSYGKLLENVCEECELGVNGMVPIKRFYYDAYSSCINGSIFDGLKMDLISFAGGLLNSDSSDEQLIGSRILQKFVTNGRFAADTLRKIGTSASVIERLIDMLYWKNPAEEEIRRSAAKIVSKLAGKKQNALRVGAITGAMESISSLLDNEFPDFNLLGLLILKKLARDHTNCGKIGNARGLLAKIIGFTHASENLLRDESMPESQIKPVKRSLLLVRMLVSTTGHTGKALRKDISDIVFTVSNIRNILQYGERHMNLQKLGIEILTSLAMDEDAREKIGSTGRVIKLLLFFFKPGLTDEHNSVSVEAGAALAMLALQNKGNCTRILKEGEVVEQLVGALNESVLRINSSRILRNLCAYTGTESFDRGTESFDRLIKGVTAAVPTVLKFGEVRELRALFPAPRSPPIPKPKVLNAVMDEKEELLEVSVGLAAQILRLTSPEEFTRAGIKDTDFAEKLVQILKTYDYPEIKVPRIRRFAIEVAIQMMKSQEKYILFFKNSSMEEVLKSVGETTSGLECFNVFSGSVGLSRHNTTISALVDTALELMTKG